MIYSFCQTKNFRLIREMTLCLVEYFRYLNQKDFRLAPLRDELAHMNNYLHIQTLRFPGRFDCEISCPEALGDYLVPTLLLQTFVENAIKHGAGGGKLALRVAASLEEREEGPHLHLLVEDNGEGFPPTVLETIRSGEPVVKEDGRHIGVWNAVRRVRLLYGERGSVEFGEAVPLGTSVHINIPAIRNEEDACISS